MGAVAGRSTGPKSGSNTRRVLTLDLHGGDEEDDSSALVLEEVEVDADGFSERPISPGDETVGVEEASVRAGAGIRLDAVARFERMDEGFEPVALLPRVVF